MVVVLLAGAGAAYGLCDIVNDYGAVRVAVVHWREGFIPFLARCIPDFEFHGGLLVEGDGLGEEGGADGGFSVVVELVLLARSG